MADTVLALVPLDHPSILGYKAQAEAVRQEIEALVITTQDDLDRATVRLGEIVLIPQRATEFRLKMTAPFREHVDAVNKTVKDVVAPLVAAEKMLREKWQAAKRRLDAEAEEAKRREALRQQRVEDEARAEAAKVRLAEAAARDTGYATKHEAIAALDQLRADGAAVVAAIDRRLREAPDAGAYQAALQDKYEHDLRQLEPLRVAKAAILAFDRLEEAARVAAPVLVEAARPTPPAMVQPARAVAGGTKITERSGAWTYEVTDATLVPRAYLRVDPDSIKAAIRAGIRDAEGKPGIPGIRIFQDEGGIAVGKAR